jgi:hypothetical protein
MPDGRIEDDHEIVDSTEQEVSNSNNESDVPIPDGDRCTSPCRSNTQTPSINKKQIKTRIIWELLLNQLPHDYLVVISDG